MNKLINIGNDNLSIDNEIFTGDNFEDFLRSLPPMSQEEVLRIKKSTISILSKCVAPKFKEPSYDKNTGLVIGYIQSGKTMSFTSLIALASDNGYKIVIVLAGTTTILLNQTIDRLTEDLSNKNEYVIIPESGMDKVSKISNILKNEVRERIIILPILKQWQHIEKLNELFISNKIKPLLSRLGVLIIDDEADQASLNGLARRNYKLSKKKKISDIVNDDEKNVSEYTTTYNRISTLKELLPNHSYIQYTATPQANLLLDQRDILRPTWCEILEPGNKYTGGLRFFNNKKDLIIEIDKENVKDVEEPEMPESLRHAYRFFLLESAILSYDYKGIKRIKDKVEMTSMMLHADRLIQVNDIYLRWLKNYNNNIYIDLKSKEYEVLQRFKEIYNELKINLKDYFEDYPKFEQVLEKILYYVLEEIEFWFVAGKNDNEVKWKRFSHHVLIGGQKLDRGFTVKNLIVTYMPRTTKSKSNADTIEQRCRFFGYKKDYIEACKVYLPQESINEFEEYVDFEKKLRSYLKTYTIDEFYDNGRLMNFGLLNPTSLNKIPGELIKNNFRNFNYFQPDFENRVHNDNIIINFLKGLKRVGVLQPTNDLKNSSDNKHILFESKIEQIKKILKKIKFNSSREQVSKLQFLSILDELDHNKKAWVIQIANERDKNGGRPRSLKIDGRIKSLASNYPPYFGDRDLMINTKDLFNFNQLYNNEPIIQIHKIKILPNEAYPANLKKLSGTSINVIATVMPNKNTSTSFISVNYD